MTSNDESWTSWLCDLEPEDYKIINDINIAPTSLQQSFSGGSHCSHTTSNTMSNSSGDVNCFERPTKTLKTNPSNIGYPSLPKKDSSHSYILCFDNENQEPKLEPMLNIDSTLKPKGKVFNHGKSLTSKGSLENQKKGPKRNIQESKKTDSAARNAQDHILAERKRREKISQKFIALSALLPDLKKMDKASVLGDAINHVKQLQEKVKLLEEKNQRNNVESVVYVEKTKSCSSDEDVSDTSSNSGYGNCCHTHTSKPSRSLPEVEARVSEKNVLIRVHCEKHKSVLMNIIQEIENLHLSVTSSCALLFGTTKLDITIIAEMDEKFSLSVQELARKLQIVLL